MFAPEDDGNQELRDLIRKTLAQGGSDDEEDSGGFDAPLKETGAEPARAVPLDEGNELAAAARFGTRATAVEKDVAKDIAKTIEAGPDGDTAPAAAKSAAPDAGAQPEPAKSADAATEKSSDGKPVADVATQPDLTKASADELLTGLDDTKKGEVSRRLAELEAWDKFFEPHAEALKLHGTTAREQVARLAHLNDFAQKKPDEYLAWFLDTVGGADKTAILEKAAKHLGVSVTIGQSDDDEFVDPEVKALRDEVAALRRQNGPAYGPDAAPNRTQDELTRLINETGPDGKPVRPYYDFLAPQIADRVAALRNERGGAPATVADVAAIYTELEGRMRTMLGVQPLPSAQPATTSAAQGQPPVADKTQNNADALEKAKRASKSIDGAGQGTPRRPAQSGSGSLRDDMSAILADMKARGGSAT